MGNNFRDGSVFLEKSKKREFYAIIRDSKRNLLLKYNKDDDNVVVEFISGEIGNGESPKEALLRGLMDTVGIIPNEIDVFGKISRMGVEEHIFVADIDEILDDELSEKEGKIIIVSIDTISNLPISNKTKEILDDFLSNIRK